MSIWLEHGDHVGEQVQRSSTTVGSLRGDGRAPISCQVGGTSRGRVLALVHSDQPASPSKERTTYSGAPDPLPIATGYTGLAGGEGLPLNSAGIARVIMNAKPSP
jgi:hypothetical protein